MSSSRSGHPHPLFYKLDRPDGRRLAGTRVGVLQFERGTRVGGEEAVAAVLPAASVRAVAFLLYVLLRLGPQIFCSRRRERPLPSGSLLSGRCCCWCSPSPFSPPPTSSSTKKCISLLIWSLTANSRRHSRSQTQKRGKGELKSSRWSAESASEAGGRVSFTDTTLQKRSSLDGPMM